jgi:importin subunit alpha-1
LSGNLVLECNALTPLLGLLNNCKLVSLKRNAMWTLSNLMRGKPQPQQGFVSMV